MPSSGDSIRSAIEQANRRFEATYRTGDPAAVARLYTDDAQLFPTGSDTVEGHSALATFWQGVMDLGIVDAKLDTREVESHGETAIETGHYTLFGDDQYLLDQGKYLVVWKFSQGEWKLHRDIWNTSLPPRV